MDWFQWAIAIGIGSVASVICQIAFIGVDKRLKKASAVGAEYDNLQKQITDLNIRIDGLNKEIGRSDEEKKQYRRDIEASEAKRYKLKSCISAAHNCHNRTLEGCLECPVLEKQRKLEKEWAEYKGQEGDGI